MVAGRATRRFAIGALATIDPRAAAARAAEWLASTKDPAEAEDLIARLARLKSVPPALAAALVGKTLEADVAKLSLRAGRDHPPLVAAIRKAGGLGEAPKPLTDPEKQAVLAAVASQGNAARGEAVFRRKDSQCLKCHAVAGAGGQVGPSLESVGASAPVDYLLDALLEPNKAIKENYHSITVATSDGKVVSGIKVRESGQELVLRDAEDRELAIPVSTIEDRKAGPSLMPLGATDSLTRGELVDLVRFLSELGKIGPYSVSKARLVRRWQVLEADPAAFRELRRWGLQTVAKTDGNGYGSSSGSALTWSPAYSEVSGTLPLDAMPVVTLGALPGSGAELGATGFARFQIDVSTPGAVRLAFNSTRGLSLWMDGTAIEPRESIDIDLSSGVHTLTVVVKLGDRTEGLRCAIEDVPGSPARAQAVVGK